MKQTNYLGTTRYWWVVLVLGILLIISGFAYWFWPAAGYLVASQLFGWMLILAGVVQLCAGSSPKRAGGRGWWIVGGIIDIFVGFMMVRSVVLSATVLPYFLAAIFLFWGVESFIGAAAGRRSSYRWLGIVNGILLCIISFFFLEAGFISNMYMVSLLTAVAFIYWGFTVTTASFDMKPAGNDKPSLR